MRMLETSAFEVAQRYVGVKEVPGTRHNPMVLSMLKLDTDWPKEDEVPWCSAFVNWIAWHLRLPRSKSLMARSWLGVGQTVDLDEAAVGGDIVILWRLRRDSHAGHVGFYAGHNDDSVYILGGNQGDEVSVKAYDASRLLGIRRLY